ncbi:hypothetical protein GEMRC1_013439 [Eukaryota sp. GEM-RC1]
MITVCEREFENDMDKVSKLKNDLVKFLTSSRDDFELLSSFEDRPVLDTKFAGILHLNYEGVSTPNAEEILKYSTIFGQDFITSSLSGLTFDIGIDAFFQVNKNAAEVMYQKAIDESFEGIDSNQKDCCVTRNRALDVIGVDINATSIENAKENVLKNSIDSNNLIFKAGPAEEVLEPVIDEYLSKFDSKEVAVSAIVDPPRSGLHKNASLALRKVKNLTKFVYMACKPQSLAESIVPLTRRSSHFVPGIPFVPTKACIVDMFPGTPHVEVLLVFERLPIDDAMLADPGLGERDSKKRRKRSELEMELKRKRK